MKENSGGAMLLLLGGVIGVLIGVAIGVALLSYAYPVFHSDKWAAWVQAIGSILALVGVYWATQRQSQMSIESIHESARLRNEERAQASLAILNGSLKIVEGIKEIINKSMEEGLKERDLKYLEAIGELTKENFDQRLKLIFKRIENVDVSSFRKEQAINGFVGYLTIFEAMAIQLSLVLDGAYKHPSIGPVLMEIEDDGERGRVAMSANKSQLYYLLKQIEALEEKHGEITKALEGD